jgi:hypothetical protein
MWSAYDQQRRRSRSRLRRPDHRHDRRAVLWRRCHRHLHRQPRPRADDGRRRNERRRRPRSVDHASCLRGHVGVATGVRQITEMIFCNAQDEVGQEDSCNTWRPLSRWFSPRWSDRASGYRIEQATICVFAAGPPRLAGSSAPELVFAVPTARSWRYAGSFPAKIRLDTRRAMTRNS